MGKEYIVDTATCLCKYGTTPGILKVSDDGVGMNGKPVATNQTLGAVFVPPGFGACKKSWPSRPCSVQVTGWSGCYEGVCINGAYSLTDTSKGSCACGGTDCIAFRTTGQVAVPGLAQLRQSSCYHQYDLNAQGYPLEALLDESAEMGGKPSDGPASAPRKVLDIYWEDGDAQKQYVIIPHQEVSLRMATSGYRPDEEVAIEVVASLSHKFKEGVTRLLKGRADTEGIVKVDGFEISYEEGKNGQDGQQPSMLLFRDGTNGTEITSWTELPYRKVFYIHGTTGDNTRWKNHNDTVNVLNRIALGCSKEEIQKNGSEILRHCDFLFEWNEKTNIENGYFNNLLDRRQASKRLLSHIQSAGLLDEIVLIGHSHGGNVAIQSADKILSAMPQIKHVYVLTIGTPAANEETFKSYASLDGFRLVKEYKELVPNAVTSGNTPTLVMTHKVPCHLYLNPENPGNWQHRGKITHLALWNDNDWVDGAAGIGDTAKSLTGIGLSTMNSVTDYFTNGFTHNVRFSINPKKVEAAARFRLSSRRSWKILLDYLTYLIEGRLYTGYSVPSIIRKLRPYSEYEQFFMDRLHRDHGTASFYLHEISKLQQLTKTGNLETDKHDYHHLSMLRSILTESDADKYLSELEYKMKKHVREGSSIPQPNEVVFHFQLQWLLDYTEREYDPDAEERLERQLAAARDTFLGEHGFDLSAYGEIEKAIDDGRIEPFPRAWGNKSSGTSKSSKQ